MQKLGSAGKRRLALRPVFLASAANRMALVVANEKLQAYLSDLNNPVSDSRLIGAKLKELGTPALRSGILIRNEGSAPVASESIRAQEAKMRRFTSALLAGLIILSYARFASAKDAVAPANNLRASSTVVPRKGEGRVRMQSVRSPRAAEGEVALQSFVHAPFPYDGEVPEKGKRFLDVVEGNRRGHTSPRGGVNWEDTTYSDNRTLLYVPKAFNRAAHAAIVIFFHGNLARLDRDVRGRQRVLQQLSASKLNAILIAPQFAVNALDSSAGKFYQPGAFRAFMGEADDAVANLTKGQLPGSYLKGLPIIIVAYSGGYLPAAFTLSHMRDSDRIAGVILLDALYGEVDKFADWLAAQNQRAFFFSAYSQSSAGQNALLRKLLAERGVRFGDGLPRALAPGVINFMSVQNAVHNDFVTSAWTADPLKAALSRVAAAMTGETPAAAPDENRPAPFLIWLNSHFDAYAGVDGAPAALCADNDKTKIRRKFPLDGQGHSTEWCP